MASKKALKGLAHDIAHHASSGVSGISPHMGTALRQAGMETGWVELLEESPYLHGIGEEVRLRRGLATLHAFSISLLCEYGFGLNAVKSIRLYSTAPPWDESGYLLHARVVILGDDGRSYDSGWLE